MVTEFWCENAERKRTAGRPSVDGRITLKSILDICIRSCSMQIKMCMEHWWNDTDRGKPNYSETCPSVTLSNTEHTWPDVRQNAGLRGETPASKHLSHCTAFEDRDVDNFQFMPRGKHHIRYENNQLILYREIIAVCSEIRVKDINTLCGQYVEFLKVKHGK